MSKRKVSFPDLSGELFLFHKPGKRYHARMKCHLLGVRIWST